jgi:hypothetical protein
MDIWSSTSSTDPSLTAAHSPLARSMTFLIADQSV